MNLEKKKKNPPNMAESLCGRSDLLQTGPVASSTSPTAEQIDAHLVIGTCIETSALWQLDSRAKRPGSADGGRYQLQKRSWTRSEVVIHLRFDPELLSAC